MELNLTVQGFLIYGALLAHLGAFVVLMARRRKVGTGLYAAGFLLAAAAWIYRWQHVDHLPMQNLFEVFITLGVVSFPLWLLGKLVLGVDARAADAFIGFVVLFPAGFVFESAPQKLPPALQSWLFGPHVGAYMLAYMVMIKASVQAVAQLLGRRPEEGAELADYERGTYRIVSLGFPLLTLGLVLGAWWGKIAWGGYWNWDPKELWSLASWLVYVGYLHFRYSYGRRYPRVNSSLVVLGSIAIVITLLWVNLSKIFQGLHSYA
jgi:ABC-type transport system involved in cytochrome c biogenesis permease subunit